jgi:hypothetical protein
MYYDSHGLEPAPELPTQLCFQAIAMDERTYVPKHEDSPLPFPLTVSPFANLQVRSEAKATLSSPASKLNPKL